MAAADIEARHTLQIPRFVEAVKDTASVSVTESTADPKEVVQKWLIDFEKALSSNDATAVADLIHEEGWWRDHLAFSWDFHTCRGLSEITKFLEEPRLKQAGMKSLKPKETGKFAPHKETPIEGLDWTESMFEFETTVGLGKGMVRLVPLNGVYKAHMIYTSLQELKGYPEIAGAHRPHGGNNSLKGSGSIEGNWYERRQRQIEFLDGEPQCLIVGAGQSGLSMGARLQALELSCLIIDKNQRIGDNWRHRYRTLVTHDPVQYTHPPFMPFPTNWPLFTPKDKLADWFEIYASAMELNIWLGSRVQSAEYDEEKKKSWTIHIQRGDGGSRVVRPQHVVFCTGHAGEPKIPTFPGQTSFKGTIYHGSQHRDATFSKDIKGKKIIVVGTGNSGHDISQNYYENGAEVTMLQRAGTYVISASKGLFMIHEGMYDETGPPIEDADVAGQSLPIPVQFVLNVNLTQRIKAAEKANHEGLEKAGFKICLGNDGSGIYRKYITRGGGYYIDVGASQLIIDGKIKVVQSPDGIKGFSEDKLILADGRELDADIVVLATGYDNMRTTLRKTLGDKIADRCNDVWDLDKEGEVNAMWRPSGHPKLWFMGGSLALARIYSKILALQIKAEVEGLVEE